MDRHAVRNRNMWRQAAPYCRGRKARHDHQAASTPPPPQPVVSPAPPIRDAGPRALLEVIPLVEEEVGSQVLVLVARHVGLQCVMHHAIHHTAREDSLHVDALLGAKAARCMVHYTMRDPPGWRRRAGSPAPSGGRSPPRPQASPRLASCRRRRRRPRGRPSWPARGAWVRCVQALRASVWVWVWVCIHREEFRQPATRTRTRRAANLQHLGVDPKLRHGLGRLQHLLHLGRLHQLPDDGTHTRWGYKQAIGQERSVGGAVAASGNMMRLESNVALQGPS